MPTFPTSEPVQLVVHIEAGTMLVTASVRKDAVVRITPASPANTADVRAADQAHIEMAGNTITVRTPRQRSLFGRSGSVHVVVELPEGSGVRASAAKADFRGEGRLGECRVKIAHGDIRLDDGGPLHLGVGFGDVSVRNADGHTEITACGSVHVARLAATAVVKNSNGDTTIGDVLGDLRVHSANGDVHVDRARATVNVRTARGDIRIDEVGRGAVELLTACGRLEIGIDAGTAAWLDARSAFGSVRNALGRADAPGRDEEAVRVRARTQYGDIVLRHA